MDTAISGLDTIGDAGELCAMRELILTSPDYLAPVPACDLDLLTMDFMNDGNAP